MQSECAHRANLLAVSTLWKMCSESMRPCVSLFCASTWWCASRHCESRHARSVCSRTQLCLKSLSHALVMMLLARIREHQKTRNWKNKTKQKFKTLGRFGVLNRSKLMPGAWVFRCLGSSIAWIWDFQFGGSKVSRYVTLFCPQLPAVASSRLSRIPMRPITNEPVEPDIEVLWHVLHNWKIVIYCHASSVNFQCFWMRGLLSCGKPSLPGLYCPGMWSDLGVQVRMLNWVDG